MKYSVVIPTIDGVRLLSESLPRIFIHTQDFEVIVVDNGSTDGTEGYINDLSKQHSNLKYIRFDTNKGFAGACNAGMQMAQGAFIILLNNDALVTPNWTSQMFTSMRRFEKKTGLRIGLVGPATNFAGGRQAVPNVKYDIAALDEFSIEFHKRNISQVDEAGFLSGFCLMFKRAVMEDVGLLDERFFPGGYEDNDFLLRANESGWYGLIDGSTFVHHHGSQTLRRDEFKDSEGGLAPRNIFLDKWTKKNAGPKKLVGIYRVKGPDPYFTTSLQKASEFCDEIAVLVDNPLAGDRSVEITKKFPKVTRTEITDREFDERRDRNQLVQMAYDMEADWVISIDDDEVFEDKFDRAYVDRLMHPPNPHVKMYGFHWRTFFDGTERFRVDGTFGKMAGFRMYKAEPGRKIFSGTDKGFHCGNIALSARDCARWTNIRIKHYGYCTPEKCMRKYKFYEHADTEKTAGLIGAEDYSHLIQRKMITYPWVENDSLSLVICVRNGGHKLWELFDQVGYFADEIIFGDNQSTDDSVKTAKLFKSKIIPVKFEDDFSKLKNQVIEKASKDWILLMDWDETFVHAEIPSIRKMMDNDCDGYMFPVYNHQPGGAVSLSEAVRLFRNIPTMRYTGRVHENFDAAMHANLVSILRTDMILHHHGFLSDAKRLDGKLNLYERLNKLQLQETPADPRAAFNLALHYINEGNRIEAERLLKYAISLNENFYQAHKELGLSYIRKGQAYVTNAKALIPEEHPMKQMLERLVQSITGIIGEQDIIIGSRGQDGPKA